MKGTFFNAPLELSLETNGESWHQGEEVSGILVTKSHSDNVPDLSDQGIFLVSCDIKKYKAKNPKSISILDEILYQSSDNLKLDFKFKLADNCMITEKGKSLYLLCGNKNNLIEAGSLQLQILPAQEITNILQTIETFLRFKVKSIKNKKTCLDVKIQAPNSKDYGAIEQLNLEMTKSSETIQLKYNFKVKRLEYTPIGVEAQTKTLIFDQVLDKKQYSSFGDSINQDGIQSAFNEILEHVKSKTLM